MSARWCRRRKPCCIGEIMNRRRPETPEIALESLFQAFRAKVGARLVDVGYRWLSENGGRIINKDFKLPQNLFRDGDHTCPHSIELSFVGHPTMWITHSAAPLPWFGFALVSLDSADPYDDEDMYQRYSVLDLPLWSSLLGLRLQAFSLHGDDAVTTASLSFSVDDVFSKPVVISLGWRSEAGFGLGEGDDLIAFDPGVSPHVEIPPLMNVTLH